MIQKWWEMAICKNKWTTGKWTSTPRSPPIVHLARRGYETRKSCPQYLYFELQTLKIWTRHIIHNIYAVKQSCLIKFDLFWMSQNGLALQEFHNAPDRNLSDPMMKDHHLRNLSNKKWEQNVMNLTEVAGWLRGQCGRIWQLMSTEHTTDAVSPAAVQTLLLCKSEYFTKLNATI